MPTTSIRAQFGVERDLPIAVKENEEVYDFLLSAGQRYGMGFWKPGAGIIHQVVLENYAFPGGMMIGTDSHTPNAGGLGMIAIGVGGADAVDVMVGLPWELRWPGVIGVKLTGEFSGWTSPKDVILKVAGILTVKGGTGSIVEYFGPGVRSISATGKGTICNMGAELGATTSVFPFDERMATYLRATGRDDVAEMAMELADCLRADGEVEEEPERFYDRVIEIDLSTLQPHVVGPYSPDLDRPISAAGRRDCRKGLSGRADRGLGGQLHQFLLRGHEPGGARRTPGAGQRAELQDPVPDQSRLRANSRDRRARRAAGRVAGDGRDDFGQRLRRVHWPVAAHGCGAGREELDYQQLQSELFRPQRRQSGHALVHRVAGDRDGLCSRRTSGLQPTDRFLVNAHGELVRLDPPRGDELPSNGFIKDETGLVPPLTERRGLDVVIDPASDRLALLEPFAPWNGQDFVDLPILLKAKGKCTTDHISPAGPWLKYRGHIDNISNNLFIGVVSAYDHPAGKGKNVLTGENDVAYAAIARDYKSRGLSWVAIADENYGEGSSREHAAMEPRYLGGVAVIARSFARIAETNLKKQGVLPLTFENPADYDKIREDDRVSLLGVTELAPGSKVRMVISHADGTVDEATLIHTFSDNQIEWVKAGSALNLIRQRQGKE